MNRPLLGLNGLWQFHESATRLMSAFDILDKLLFTNFSQS